MPARATQGLLSAVCYRKHLKNENGPAKDADELWSMMRGAATALGTGIGTSLTGEPDKAAAPRPGKVPPKVSRHTRLCAAVLAYGSARG